MELKKLDKNIFQLKEVEKNLFQGQVEIISENSRSYEFIDILLRLRAK